MTPLQPAWKRPWDPGTFPLAVPSLCWYLHASPLSPLRLQNHGSSDAWCNLSQ